MCAWPWPPWTPNKKSQLFAGVADYEVLITTHRRAILVKAIATGIATGNAVMAVTVIRRCRIPSIAIGSPACCISRVTYLLTLLAPIWACSGIASVHIGAVTDSLHSVGIAAVVIAGWQIVTPDALSKTGMGQWHSQYHKNRFYFKHRHFLIKFVLKIWVHRKNIWIFWAGHILNVASATIHLHIFGINAAACPPDAAAMKGLTSV